MTTVVTAEATEILSDRLTTESLTRHAPDQANLWRVRNHVAAAMKSDLDAAGIRIPFPQRVLSFAAEPGNEGERERGVETSERRP